MSPGAPHRPRRWASIVPALALLLAANVPSATAQAKKIPVVGILGVTTAAGYARQVAALRQGFRELGYVEGQNIVLEFRWADGRYDQLPVLAAELVRLQPDAIITSGPGTRVLKSATTTIPIVMAVSLDAAASGLIASLGHPGGNITGSTAFGPELSTKRLEILKLAVPKMARVGVLLNPTNTTSPGDYDAVRKTAAALQVELIDFPARSPNEFHDAFTQMARRRVDGVLIVNDSMFVANMRRLGELSLAHRLPGIGSEDYVDGGGLVAYGANFPDLWRRAPAFVDKILKGRKPGEIPVEQPTRFDLAINTRTARSLGIALPSSLRARASHVIE